MKRNKIVVVIALLAVIVAVFTCCGKAQPHNLSAESKAVYEMVAELERTVQYQYFITYALADVNGDGKAELISQLRESHISVYEYDEKNDELVLIFQKPQGKSKAIGYYNVENCQLMFPSGSTGGQVFEIVEFSGKESSVIKRIEYINGKHSESGQTEYYIDDVACTEEEFESERATIVDGFTAIELTAEEVIALLSE